MAFNERPSAPVSESTIAAVHEAANQADAAGLSFLPPAEDGTKRPLPNPHGRWDPFKTVRPTAEQLQRWYPGRSGLGIVTGAVSGRVECWDFDDRSTYEAVVTTARNCGLGTVIDNIETGYCDDTPGDGVRWLVRYPAEVERAPGSRTILARRPKLPAERQHDKDNIKVLIELPAFSIVAPTNGRVHPSGRPYLRRSGSFSSIAAYTSEERDALIELAHSFDAMPRREPDHKAGARTQDNRPGDDFTSRTTWTELLSPHGWTDLFTRDGTTYWRRPGKKFGISATTNHRGADLLYVFTSSTELEAEKSYSRFGAYTVLNHGGDFQAAARELVRQGYGRKSSTPSDEDVSDYKQTETGIKWRRLTREGVVWTALTNFSARIVSDITQDDGIETLRALEIAAAINDRAQTTFVVAAAQFAQMTWPLEHLGAEAVVQPGQGSKDRARAAIQILSGRIPQRRVYTHTGWRKVDGQMVYMHAGGALGPDGPVGGLEVQLPEQLERYLLPGTDGGLREHVEASLAMRSVASDRVTIPLLGGVYRAAIGEADFSVHISGPTGVQKSEITALGQQHYGATMDARALPGSWTSTGNALEAIASAAKDALLVIDDYVPQGTTADRARLNAIADRVLRAQGNRSGRGRLRSDATMRRSRPPRGLIVSTGEEVPGGQSLRARMVIVEVRPGEVDLDKLTHAQRAAARGDYAAAMAGFIRWLATRLDQVRTDLIAISRERRAHVDVAHARTADTFAQIFATWVIWLRFVIEVGVVTRDEADAIEGEVWSTLTTLAAEQQDLQRTNEPVHRFYALLSAVLSSGRAHISSADSPDRRPDDVNDAKALGWRRNEDGSWHPQGPCIGWWAEDGIYLQPDASYAAVQQLGAGTGEGVGVASATLHRRMFERGQLLSTERRGGETRLKSRKTVGRRRQHVLHIAHSTLASHAAQSGPTGPSDPMGENDQPDQEVA